MSNQDNHDSHCAYQQEQEQQMWLDAQKVQNEFNEELNELRGKGNELANEKTTKAA